METGGEDKEVNKRLPRVVVGLLAALPFLMLQLIYLADPHGWSSALGYGLLIVVIIVLLVCWSIYAVIETRKRSGFSPGWHRVPWFGLVGFLFLVGFFFVVPLAKPFVLKVPAWCWATQITSWETSLPNVKYGGGQSFILVLNGKGNIASHEFTTGHLNWTGEKPAGFSKVDPDDQRYSYWNGYYEESIPASLDALRERMENSGITEEEVTRISGEIWEAIGQAQNGFPIKVHSGSVNPVTEFPLTRMTALVGTSFWMVILLVMFQFIARFSLPPTKRSSTKN